MIDERQTIPRIVSLLMYILAVTLVRLPKPNFLKTQITNGVWAEVLHLWVDVPELGRGGPVQGLLSFSKKRKKMRIHTVAWMTGGYSGGKFFDLHFFLFLS